MKELHGIVEYDKKTGIMCWLVASNRGKIGNEVGYINVRGYRAFEHKNKEYLVHRVAFFFCNDRIPVEIDHINHIRNDNRICNLRESNPKLNARNISMPKRNTSGFVGVHFRKDSKKWRAIMSLDGRKVSLGQFDTREEAIEARIKGNIKYGFHENHGKNVNTTGD